MWAIFHGYLLLPFPCSLPSLKTSSKALIAFFSPLHPAELLFQILPTIPCSPISGSASVLLFYLFIYFLTLFSSSYFFWFSLSFFFIIRSLWCSHVIPKLWQLRTATNQGATWQTTTHVSFSLSSVPLSLSGYSFLSRLSISHSIFGRCNRTSGNTEAWQSISK